MMNRRKVRSLMLAALACLASLDKATANAPGDANDPALQPPPVNTAPGPQYADDTRLFQGIPGIERAANGRLWAALVRRWTRRAGRRSRATTSCSSPAPTTASTWSGPKLVIDPPGPVRAYDPCLWHDPLGRLWLFWAQSYHLLGRPLRRVGHRHRGLRRRETRAGPPRDGCATAS